MTDWNDIQLVLEITRQGSLSHAARVLGLSHSTLSRRVAELERRSSARLFDRLPAGLSPTSAGQEMAEVGARIEAEVLALDLALVGRDKELSGVLKITAPALLIEVYLGSVLNEFIQANPNIDLRVNATHQPLNLARREADVAIRATNDPPQGLFGRRVAIQRRAVYAAKSYFSGKPTLQVDAPKDAGFDWLGFDWWSDDEIKGMPGSRIIARFDDMMALLGALRAGMGIARLPLFLGDADPKLVRLTAFEIEPYFDFWVLTHPSLKDVARVRSFMRFVADRFERDRSLFEGADLDEK